MVDPSEALRRLRQQRDDGSLAQFCSQEGIDLLVAFGSAVTPHGAAEPRDLDLALRLAPETTILGAIEALVAHVGTERIDVMDLARADVLARHEALAPGELLAERTPGTFAEAQIQAVVEHADTAWMRELQLAVLAE